MRARAPGPTRGRWHPARGRDGHGCRPLADGLDELGEGRPLGADGVGHAVVRLRCLRQAQGCEVVDMDAPDPVVAPAADGKDGQPAQEPGDVVEQDPVAAEEDGGADDRVRHIALRQCPLHEGLAPEVGQRRAAARVGDAHVHDPLDPGPPGGVEERPRVGDRSLVVDGAVGEAHPVRVVQGGRSGQRCHQALSDRRSRVAGRRWPCRREPVRDAR